MELEDDRDTQLNKPYLIRPPYPFNYPWIIPVAGVYEEEGIQMEMNLGYIGDSGW